MKTLSVSSVEIPGRKVIGKKFSKKMASLQNSFDYMKNNYGLDFLFCKRTNSELFVVPKAGDYDVVRIKKYEDNAETARKIYEVVSRALRPENQKSGYESKGVKPKDIDYHLDSTFKMFRGLLEYYAKKHDGLTFYVYGFSAKDHLNIECKKESKNESVIIYADNTEEGYSKIHQMVANVLKGEN